MGAGRWGDFYFPAIFGPQSGWISCRKREERNWQENGWIASLADFADQPRQSPMAIQTDAANAVFARMLRNIARQANSELYILPKRRRWASQTSMRTHS